MTTLLLVRHAVHDHPPDVLVGRTPGVHLGVGGGDQAARLAARLATRAIDAVISSPLERARETAAAVAARRDLDVAVCDAVVELDYGAWTGRRLAALAGDPAWEAWNARRSTAQPPGGESMANVQRRVLPALTALAARHRREVVVVTHADVIRAVLVDLLRMPVDECLRLDVSPASISAVVLDGETAVVHTVNDTAHLDR